MAEPKFKLCLLIDDNFIDNFVTRKILETSNFAEQIVVIQSAPEAIAQIQAKKNSTRCDLLRHQNAIYGWL
jgi:CheY-like chemotaxis protein